MTHTIHKHKPTRSPKVRGDPMLRLAARLHALLSAPATRPDPEALLRQAIRTALDGTAALQRIWQQASAARAKGWHAAAGLLLQRVPAAAEAVRGATAALLRLPAPGCDVLAPPSLGELLAELRALRAEFGELQIDAHLTCLSVHTDPITLEDRYLGPFRIELHLSELRAGRVDGSAFRCVATDPRPASASEGTTHPHVRDELPCLGDAAVPVRSALRAGRLADAFLAVQSVLQTYNSASPYVSLADWDGRACADCGGTRSEDELYSCDACGLEYCDRCHGTCEACEHGCCRGCLETGEQDERLCPDCRGRCVECDAVASSSALQKQDGLCGSCFEASESAEEAVAEDPSSALTLQPSPQETDHEYTVVPAEAAQETAAGEVLGVPSVTVAA